MPKYPAEILGYASTVNSNTVQQHRNSGICPYLRSPCHKRNQTCSVQYQDEIIAICPSRLRENELVFKNVADHYFGSRNDLLVFHEVYSGDSQLGYFDYVMVKHKSLSSEIEDFVVIEFQTVDTTNTGQLTKALNDFSKGIPIHTKNYNFGLNWSNVWKRCFIQILNKGRVLEKWGHQAYWIIQEPTYKYLLDAYGLHGQLSVPGENETTVFMVYDLVADSQRGYRLSHNRVQGTNIQSLLKAFSENPHVPSKENFIKSLQSKTRRKGINFQLNLDG